MTLALLSLLLSAEPKVHQTPVWAPRYATLQVFIRPPVAVPALRLGWEVDLIEGQRDVLVWPIELGLAYTHVNADVPFWWSYCAMTGIGYRNQRDSGLFWGFNLLGGVAYYGYKLESQWSVYVEGRAMVGGRIGPITLAFTLGYAQWVARLPLSVAQNYLGGPMVGAWLGWK